MPMYVKTSGNGLDGLKKALDTLKEKRVLVGIPLAQDKPHGNLTNVQLAFIMTDGSPKKGIPARPFLEPSLNDPAAQSQITREMKNAALAAVNGNSGGVDAALNNVGIAGQNAVKNGMPGTPPPNKPATIARKGSAVPLIDTSNLQGSITYVVE